MPPIVGGIFFVRITKSCAGGTGKGCKSLQKRKEKGKKMHIPLHVFPLKMDS